MLKVIRIHIFSLFWFWPMPVAQKRSNSERPHLWASVRAKFIFFFSIPFSQRHLPTKYSRVSDELTICLTNEILRKSESSQHYTLQISQSLWVSPLSYSALLFSNSFTNPFGYALLDLSWKILISFPQAAKFPTEQLIWHMIWTWLNFLYCCVLIWYFRSLNQQIHDPNALFG